MRCALCFLCCSVKSYHMYINASVTVSRLNDTSYSTGIIPVGIFFLYRLIFCVVAILVYTFFQIFTKFETFHYKLRRHFPPLNCFNIQVVFPYTKYTFDSSKIISYDFLRLIQSRGALQKKCLPP